MLSTGTIHRYVTGRERGGTIIVRAMSTNVRATFVTDSITLPSHATRLLPARDCVPARSRARATVGVGCVTFLWVYAGLHLGHAWGVEVPLVRSAVPIPLFAIFVVSVATAALFAMPLASVLVASRRSFASLPTVLAFSIAVFTGAVMLFP